MIVTHKVWRPSSKKRPQVETLCAVLVEVVHPVDFGAHVEAASHGRPHAAGRCVDCFGPIDGVMPSAPGTWEGDAKDNRADTRPNRHE